MSEEEEKDNELFETLQHLSNLLEENQNLKTTNMYGGQGGFGLVLFVHDIKDKSKKYAVKAQSIINPNSGQINQNLLKLCREEAQVMRECKHKNVVEIDSDYVLGFYHFIQMNLCQCSLNDWIQQNKNKQISDLVFLHYTNQIIDGLEYLHKLDYVLRDVSVRNILLTTEGVLKLCDFGLAKKYDNTLKSKVLYSQHVQGVLFYFPPEIHSALNENRTQIKQTKEGDIWALGVCLSLIGGVQISYFSSAHNNNFIIPNAPNISDKANKLIKFILNPDPYDRPNFKEIRESIQYLFFSDEEQVNNKIKNSIVSDQTNSASTQANSNEYGLSFFKKQQDNSDSTAVVFVNSYLNQNDQQNRLSYEQGMSNKYNQKNKRLIEFNFQNAKQIYLKYQEFFEQQPENNDVLVTLGHIDIKCNCNFLQGEQYLEKVIELDNQDVDAYLGLCESILLQRQAKNYKKLRSYLDKCVQLEKTSNKSQVNNWRIFYIQAWISHVENKQSECEKYISLSLSLNKNSAVILSLEILIKFEQKRDIELAKQNFDKCMKLNENNDSIVYFRYGYFCQYYLNSIDQAQNNYSIALQFSQYHLFSLMNLAIIYNLQNNISELNEIKTQMLNQYSTNSTYYEILGTIESDPQEQIIFYSLAIENDPYQFNPYFKIIEINKNQGNLNEAIDLCYKVIQLDPENSRAYIELGKIEQNKKNTQAAIDYYSKVNRSTILSDVGKYLDGMIKELNENPRGSLKDYEDAVNINFQNIDAYKRIIFIEKERNMNILQAIRVNQTAINNNPNNEDLIESLASLQIANREYREAINTLFRLITVNPKKQGVYYQIAYIYQTHLSEIDTALSYFLQENNIQQTDNTHNSIALIYQQKQRFDLAQQHFEEALKLNQNNLVVNFNLGLMYRNTQQFQKSIDCFNTILTIDPQHAKSYFELGLIYQNFIVDPYKAIQMYETGLNFDQQTIIVYSNLGQIYKILNNIEKAIENFSKYLQFNQRDSLANFEIANLFFIKNDTHLAISYFIKTLDCDQNNEQALYQLAQAYMKVQRFPEATNCLYRYRIINPHNLKVLIDLADLESHINPLSSIELYKLVLQKEPYNKHCLQQLSKLNVQFTQELTKQSKIEFKAHNYEKLVELLKQRLIIEPNHLYSLVDLGYAYKVCGQKEKALKALEKALKIKPDSVTANLYIGQLYHYDFNDSDKAIEYLKTSTRHGNNSTSYETLGIIYRDKNYIGKAVDSFKSSIKFDSQNANSYCYLGEIFLKEYKKPKKAVEYLQKAISLNGKLPYAHYYLGEALDELDYKYEAKEQFVATLLINPQFKYAEQCQKYIQENTNAERKDFKKDKCIIF